MSSTTQTAEKSVTIADLFSKCAELEGQQVNEMKRIMRTMDPVLSYLEEPVRLSPDFLGGEFAGFRSVSLQAGGSVVMVDYRGLVTTRPLSSFITKDCLTILNNAFPQLSRLVAEKKRSEQVRPVLSFKAVLGGQKLIVDMRSYRVLISNSGGDCQDLRISFRLPPDESKELKPCHLYRGERIELDLGILKEVMAIDWLGLGLECRDVDGRELKGAVRVRLNGDGWEEALLDKAL